MTLQLQGVTRAFRRRTLFAPIDLQLGPGEQATLRGPNGSGKTTLLRVIAGLLPPTTGTVQAERFAFVNQDAPIYPELTVLEHMQFGLQAHGSPADPVETLVDAGLGRMQLERARVLSRGQRQRLHLAIAFASQANLLLLDEPFTGLDAQGESWLRQKLTHFEGSVLLTAHDEKHERGHILHLGAP